MPRFGPTARALAAALVLLAPSAVAASGALPSARLADFTLTCSPSSYTVGIGGTASGSCTVTAAGTALVSLDCVGQPPGIGCGFFPNPLFVSGGSATAGFAVAHSGSAPPPGTYSFNVRGSSPSATHTFPISVTVTTGPGDFSLSCSPSSYTIARGSSASGTCSVTSTPPFASAVTLDCTGQPAGVTCSYSPNPVTPSSGGTVSSGLTITVASTTPTGTYTFNARGTSGSTVRTFALTLTVTAPGGGDFSVGCDPSFLSIHALGSATSTCTVTSFAPFSSPVTLSCRFASAGPTCAFAPNPVTPPAGGSVSSVLTVTAPTGTPSGFYAFAVDGSGGGLQRSAQMFLLVS